MDDRTWHHHLSEKYLNLRFYKGDSSTILWEQIANVLCTVHLPFSSTEHLNFHLNIHLNSLYMEQFLKIHSTFFHQPVCAQSCQWVKLGTTYTSSAFWLTRTKQSQENFNKYTVPKIVADKWSANQVLQILVLLMHACSWRE